MDIEMLRTLCLSLPSATEDIKWENDLCFCVGGKMFCATGLEPDSPISFKVPDDSFDEISTRPGFKPAPYLARAKWVSVAEYGLLSKEEWAFFVRQSYELVRAKLPKKIRDHL
ncbi:MAG: MmcQ/YjbR family DNA-binding protein [Saprospiraceae bacterium]|nr:MmcQ/YjbR family DNA-binding protein [Saprospiraceae bacterium]